MASLAVHVIPKGGRDEIGEWRGEELSVRVKAVPEDGKANAAVCKVVAKALGLPASAVTVVRGSTSRHKLLEVDGTDADAIRRVFGSPS